MSEYRFKDRSLDIDKRVEALLSELTVFEKFSMLTTYQPPIERLGLKGFMIGAEVARGLVGREYKTTVFPEPFGLAATFDPDIMYRMGEITGIESRIYHKLGKTSLCVWGPTVDPERDPRWGRNEEAYGEDPYLIGEMSAAYTKGMAGEDKACMRVMPMLKHFYANNNEENRASDNASIPIALKHDYYLRSFETAFRKGGAKGVMASYNEINGVEALCNPELSMILKKDWGMLFSVTDGGDFMQNVLSHHSDSSFTETASRVFKNHGADIMTDSPQIVRAAVEDAYNNGLITEKDIDDALFGVFKARFLLGEIDGESIYDDYPEELVCCEEYYKASEKAALSSVILLKNDDKVLPLKTEKKTAVIGIHANMNFRDWYTGISDRDTTIVEALAQRAGEDGIVYDSGNDIIALRDTETGNYFAVCDDGSVSPTESEISDKCLFEMFDWGESMISLRSVENGMFLTDEGLMKCTAKEVFGWFVHEQLVFEERENGITLRNWQNRFIASENGKLAVSKALRPQNYIFEMVVCSDGLKRAEKIASDVEQVVLFGGNHPLINAREGYDRKHLELPEKLGSMLSRLLSVNKNTVLFMVSGYPYALHDKRLKAAMHITHAGPALGVAVAKTLFGDVSPAGRCPITWYRNGKELLDIKDYNIISTKSTYLYYTGKPLFPFGHGLSYSDFEYSSLKVNGGEFSKEDSIRLDFNVTNIGNCDSDEVAQVYIVPPRYWAATPLKELKAFRRVSIEKGETKQVSLEIKVSDLAHWDINTDSFAVYSGTYKVLVGSSSEDIRLETDVTINGDSFEGIDVSKPVPGAASFDYMGVEYKTNKALAEYALIADWQSFVSYHCCRLKGYNKVEAVVATMGGGARLELSCSDAHASFDIPPTGGCDNFVSVVSDIAPIDGTRTLTFTTGGTVALKSFRFYKA